MKKFLVVLLAGVLSSSVSYAQFKFDSLNPNCTLKKFNGGRWDTVSGSELSGQSLPQPRPLSGSNTAVGIKYNNTWYSAPQTCFESNVLAAPQEAAPTEQAEPTPAPSTKKERAHAVAHHREPKQFYVRADGGMILNMGDSNKDKSETGTSNSVSYSSSTAKAKYDITFGGAVGTYLSPNLALELQVLKNSAKQGGTISFGAPVSQSMTITGTTSILTIEAAGRYHLNMSSDLLSPFIGVSLGYASVSDKVTIAGGTGAYTVINGDAEASGTGLVYGLGLGTDINLGSTFALVPSIYYRGTTANKRTVKTSSTIVYSEGDLFTSDKISYLTLGLGLQVNF